MFDSTVPKLAAGCSSKVQKKLQAMIVESVTDTLLENRIPVSVARKLSRQMVDNIDLAEIYSIVERDIQDQHFPKMRILDRTIVHMFEILYRTINTQESIKDEETQQEFFNIVPRGECLDLFLQLVKEYCMGDDEIEKHTYKMGPLIEMHRTDNLIHWQELYQSDEFKVYLTGLLNLILTHLRKDHQPIPALNNKMPVKYHPYRINSFLNQICLLWKNKKVEFHK
ncbi:hypothetical protein [Psychromonas aquimarina]|uniref:hypothetical protein n=1 Tax=Psychromonas aquimarina TaxID=444919 RepID=UPI0003FFCEE3|nr:hypothetical protein [Psychromonas aquimarina]